MISRSLCTLLFLCIALSAKGESLESATRGNVMGSSQPTSKRCTKIDPAITEEQAIIIAKAEVLKRIGEEDAKGFTDYVVVFSSRKYNPNAYFSVLTSPDTRIVDAHITVRLNRCGKVLFFKRGL